MRPSDIDEQLWEIRDILHRAVQMQIAANVEDARSATQEAYQRLSTLLDQSQSNLRPQGKAPPEQGSG